MGKLLWFTIKYLALLFCIACSMPSQDITYYKDIQPIIETHCSHECHHSGGVGIPTFDNRSTPALIGLMLREIDAGNMPPWMPSAGLDLVGARNISQAEIATLRQWATNRIMGDELSYIAPTIETQLRPNRNYDLQVTVKQPYLPPQFTDEIHCFLLPVQPGWIEAYEAVIGEPALTHHLGADIIGPDDVVKARAKDTGQGWSCPTGVSPDMTSLGALSGISLALEHSVMYHPGYGLLIPDGGGLVLQAHYVPHVADLADQSGMRLWYAAGPLKQIRPFGVLAPSILPCPTGLSANANSPCSLEYAAAHDSLPDALKTNLETLSNCGMSISDYYNLAYMQDPVDHFAVAAGCTIHLPAGNILAVAPHAHTRATWITVDLMSADGRTTPLLNIPRWRWRWESTFWLAQALEIPPGSSVRATCELDNGELMQWNAADGQPPPGDQPAPPPRQSAQLRMYGNDRKDEMCYVRLDIVEP